MILERSGNATLRATALALSVVFQPDVDTLLFEIQVHIFDQPVLVESQQQRVMLCEIIHAPKVSNHSTKCQRIGVKP